MTRHTGSTRGKRAQYDALPPAPSRFSRPLSPNQRTGAFICGGVLLAAWLGWFIFTRPVRGELGRVQRHLEALTELENVDLAIPWFSHTMPETVELTATGLPSSFSYEVRVELKGTYDPRTRVAKFVGVKQVLMPYTKVKIEWERTVPPRALNLAGRASIAPLYNQAMLPQIYLVRHGETAWSKSHQFTGSTDIPLTDEGERLARTLGERLAGTMFKYVFTSPRLRAIRTCGLASLATASQIDARLAEWDYGDYEGKLSAQVRESRPSWNLFRDGCPGGESPAQVSARADSLIAHLRSLDGDTALFSHGHFGRVLAARWIGLPLGNAQKFILGTASISILGYEHNKIDEPVIVRWNS